MFTSPFPLCVDKAIILMFMNKVIILTSDQNSQLLLSVGLAVV